MRLSARTKPWYPTVKACSLFLSGHAGQASALAQAVVDDQPDNLEALLVLAGAQTEQGLDRRARATAQLVKERFPGIDIAAWIDSSPYQNREAVARWKKNLASIGLISSDGSNVASTDQTSTATG